jgi:hypothetical protein
VSTSPKHAATASLTKISQLGDLKLFADGNITRAFTYFESQHKCNKYCEHYGLKKFRLPPTPWARMDRNSRQIAKELAAERRSEAETGEITEGGRSRKKARK